jgi:hypothetical protein
MSDTPTALEEFDAELRSRFIYAKTDEERPGHAEFVTLARLYYQEHPTWGCLHIVMDDGNYELEHVIWCEGYASGADDRPAMKLAGYLRSLRTVQDRYAFAVEVLGEDHATMGDVEATMEQVDLIRVPAVAAVARWECGRGIIRAPAGAENIDDAEMLQDPRGVFHAYFFPTAEQVAQLADGGFIEMSQWGRQVQPFAVAVWSGPVLPIAQDVTCELGHRLIPNRAEEQEYRAQKPWVHLHPQDLLVHQDNAESSAD